MTRSFLDRTGEGWIRLVEFEVNLQRWKDIMALPRRRPDMNDLCLRMTTTYIIGLMSFALSLHNIRGDFDCFYAFTRP
jgi:hypothetical protein